MKRFFFPFGLALALTYSSSNVAAADVHSTDVHQMDSHQSDPHESGSEPSELFVGVNKSIVLENPGGVKRLFVTNTELAEAVAVSKTEVMLNGKAQGDTTLVLWSLDSKRVIFDVHVQTRTDRPEETRRELQGELPGQDVSFTTSGGNVFLKGVVNDSVSADRAVAITSTLGKVVNLLRVKVPEAEPQILLKVRFANVERTALSQLGLNLVSTGATNTIGGISTGQFGGQPTFDFTKTPMTYTFNDLLNIFLFRKDLNLGASIQALESKNLVQILAEPNLLTVSGKPASFLAGGEFPYPTLQGGGAGVGQITIQFREFGIRVHFLPVVTPRGTIQLAVAPEVSSLDYANGLTVSGYTVPGLATRRVQTEVELENGQSFAIAGLLDNRVTQTLNKIPGLSSIPFLGKLFESRLLQKNNSELLVIVTPVLVRPIPLSAKLPEVPMPKAFMKGTSQAPPQNPAIPPDDPASKLPHPENQPWEGSKPLAEPGVVPDPAAKPALPVIPAMPDAPPGPASENLPPPRLPHANFALANFNLEPQPSPDQRFVAMVEPSARDLAPHPPEGASSLKAQTSASARHPHIVPPFLRRGITAVASRAHSNATALHLTRRESPGIQAFSHRGQPSFTRAFGS